MKQCKKCKIELREGTDFCPKCGKKITNGPWKWIFSIIVILFFIGGGIALFYSNDEHADEQKNESVSVESNQKESTDQQKANNQDREKQLVKKLTDHQELLATAVSWYGEEVLHLGGKFDSWKKEVTEVKACSWNDDVANTKKGDGIYYAYQFRDGRNNNSGYVVSKDKKEIYFYSRLSIAKEVPEEPIGKVSIAELAKKMIELDAKGKIYQRADKMKVVNEKEKKEKKSKDDYANQKEVLSDYMSDWQEAMGQEYEQATVTPGDNVIAMDGVTIKNELDGGEDALLSINAKFVDLDTKQESKQGYQVIAAYSGISDNAKKYRYLFVMHNGKPEVLVAHMPEAVGDTDRGPAVNFVPTKNDALPDAFKQIMDDGSAPQAPEKSENVVNSLEDAKALYEEAFGEPAEEGEWTDEPSVEGTWISNADGSFTYEWNDEFGSRYGKIIIHPNGSMDRQGFIHGENYQGSCTYEDIQNGIAHEKLSGGVNGTSKSDKELIIDYLLSQHDSDNMPPREFYIVTASSDGSYYVQENHHCAWAEQEGLDPNIDPGVGVYKVVDGEVKKQ